MVVDLRFATTGFPPSKEEPKQEARTLNVISEDATGCCAAIRKALKQAPDLERWNCPKCGLDWMPRMVDGMRLWEARPVFQVWKRR